jgi:hypothetical protein
MKATNDWYIKLMRFMMIALLSYAMVLPVRADMDCSKDTSICLVVLGPGWYCCWDGVLWFNKYECCPLGYRCEWGAEGGFCQLN